MAKGFKDSSGKFHPTGNNGTSSREKSIETSGMKLKNEIPDDYNWDEHGNHPQQFTDEAYRKHTEKHTEISNRLNREVQDELPAIIKTVEGLEQFHRDAVHDAEELILRLKNEGHDGDPLPLEYMDLTFTEIDNFIRDWSSVDHGDQNQAIVKDLEELRKFQNKLEEYHESHGMIS